MIFDEKNASGKAGEYFFAFWICSQFDWACRLLDIDIGIDAQIEIFDESCNSTGKFINVQIKSSINKTFNAFVTKNNLTYWRTIDKPTILVNILNIKGVPRPYWMHMTKDICDEYLKKLIEKPKQEKILINFSNAKPLRRKDKIDFETLHIKETLNHYKEKLEAFSDKYDAIFDDLSLRAYKHEYLSNLVNDSDISQLETYLSTAGAGLEFASEIILMDEKDPQLTNFIDYQSKIATKKRDLIDFVEVISSYLYRFDDNEKSELLNIMEVHYKPVWKILTS
ncbi:DUF4365 domain-containing protein [Vibrio splendidus]|uniref:DUF4365 domain-containing protein n=1 Tax=Vibrio splendidus TaxID=29497 RepID=UPI00354F4EF8